MRSATAIAHPNIALCKYWGKQDRELNLPATPSLSLTLAPFHTRTTVSWGHDTDEVLLDGAPAGPEETRRVLTTLDRLAPDRPPCRVESANDFPTAAGLASSSSGFAALVVAASAAGGIPTGSLGSHARRASGSATRSLHGGWEVWPMGDDLTSRGVPLAPADWWDVRMVVAIVAGGPKAVGSTEGMLRTEATSPYYPAWVAQAPAEVDAAIEAVRARDLDALGPIVERSFHRMHATMHSADPAIVYWKPASLLCLEVVRSLRPRIRAWATMDAGPNVKVLCESGDAAAIVDALRAVADRVEVLSPGGPARLE